MKFKTNILGGVAFPAVLALAMSLVSCDNDHKPDWNETAPFDVNFVASSVADGAEIDVATNTIELSYSAPIAVSQTSAITLNNDRLSDSISTENPNVLVLKLPALKGSTQYTLTVPERTIAGIGSKTFAEGLSIRFKTAGKVLPVTDIEPLINPSATQTAKNVHQFLIENHGKKIISGAMANVNNNNDFAAWIKDKTGKDVAFTCYDFIHLPESGQNWIDYSDITPATQQWNANGLVGYMWHWRVPTDEKAYNDKDFNRYDSSIKPENGGSGTNFDIERALQEGTWENKVIMEDIDKVATYLKQLETAGIPVIWRPLHEAAGSYKYDGAWFWWGAKGGEATKSLWKLMYDRLVKHHGINNLIWVWTAQCEEGFHDRMAADYPGNEYVDVIGVDVYADNDASQIDAYNALKDVCGGKKLIVLGETGRVQDPAKCMTDGAYWSWFNLWYTYDIHKTGADTDGFGNTAASLRAVMESPYVITRDQMPSLK